MKVKSDAEIEATSVTMQGADRVSMRILIGREDGSRRMTMRLFAVAPGGHTPYHRHNYEHVVRILSGEGVAVDESGRECRLQAGGNLFVQPNEKHQFRNPFFEPLEFLCIIPNVED